MSTQYDEIAATYDRIIGNLPVRQMLEHTYRQLIGDVRGKSVLDLACGNGFYTRKFKQQGAARVVGVDISPELIAIARRHEAADPVGVEYLVGDGAQLGKIGDFDVVTTAFMLNYAPTREDLLAMCRAISNNLQGDRFVAINLNVPEGAAVYDSEAYRQYGLFYGLVDGSVDHQATIHMSVALGGDKVEFDVIHLPKADYEWAMREAGFREVRWHNPELSPAFEQQYGRDYWAPFLQMPSIIILECLK